MGVCGNSRNIEGGPRKSLIEDVKKKKINKYGNITNKNKENINKNKKSGKENIKENIKKINKENLKENIKIIKKKKILNENIKEIGKEKWPISNEEIKVNDNISLSNSTKTTTVLEEENILFPKGEQHYKLFSDISEINDKNDDLKKRYLLYFSLNNVKFPNNKHSFGISIINNKSIGIITFLGFLEDKKGKNIEFDNYFGIDYFFEKEQIIIIEPKINEKTTGVKKEIYLSDIMSKKIKY